MFRDYGRHDYAQLRFDTTAKIADNFYVRWDGTMTYFYDISEAIELFQSCGLSCERCVYDEKEFDNKKKNEHWRRRWIMGMYRGGDGDDQVRSD